MTGKVDRTSLEPYAFIGYLSEAIRNARSKEKTLGLLVLYLHRYRDIGRTYGFATTDKLISEFLERTQNILRPQDQIFRIGEAEFAVVLPDLLNPGHAELAASRLIESQRQPFVHDNNRISAEINVGMAYFPHDAQDEEALIRCAQTALHWAESRGLSYSPYSEHDSASAKQIFRIESLLHAAIENAELFAHYQPKINLSDFRVCGFEALTRWHSEEFGPVNPQLFVEVAEKSGLIVELTHWTFNTAMRQCKPLIQQFPELKLAINLSAILLRHPHLVDIVLRSLRTWDYPPTHLTLELTESAVMTDPDRSRGIIQQLKDKGIIVSIDDFGTGYSSLAYLRRLPVGELKIDKSFIFGMSANHEDQSIVRAVIDLAHTFDLQVVAEGVENAPTLHTLRDMGCETAQGFHIAKPMNIEMLVDWLEQYNPAEVAR